MAASSPIHKGSRPCRNHSTCDAAWVVHGLGCMSGYLCLRDRGFAFDNCMHLRPAAWLRCLYIPPLTGNKTDPISLNSRRSYARVPQPDIV